MERKLNLGVIGLGGRAASLLGVFRRVHSNLRVAAVADPDRDGARRAHAPARGAGLVPIPYDFGRLLKAPSPSP